MENFQFWTTWRKGFSDKDFADAFTALGILAARSRPGKLPPPAGPHTDLANMALENSVYESLKGITSTLSKISKNLQPLPWRFPMPGHRIPVGLLDYPLAALNPAALASSWRNAVTALPYNWPMLRLRLSILQYPADSPVRPWFRILFESEPSEKSVFLGYTGPSPNIYMKWPLRLGFIPANPAEHVIRKAHELWPAKDNSTVVGINRENDNCDFLVFEGNTEQLLAEIRKVPVPMKCNLFILMGPSEDTDPCYMQNIREIMTRCRANGFVSVRETIKGPDSVEFLNNIVLNLSHNLPLDAALAAALRVLDPLNPDPLIFLGKNLADFRLEYQVKQAIKKIMMMPPEAKIVVPRHTLQRMNFYMAAPVTKNASELKEVIGKKGYNRVEYHGESMGATGLSELHKAMAEAPAPEAVMTKRMERFISARTYREIEGSFTEEKRALVVGFRAKSVVWIGPPEEGAVQDKTPFDITKLPPQTEAWGLTVVLSEPNHIPEPMIRRIMLPQDGKSTVCEFEYIPKELIGFEGRISVVHRGRIIQTAVLKIPVVADISKMPETDMIRMDDIIPVRANLGELDKRTQFDMAFVTNHTSDHRPYLQAVAEDSAWLVDLEGCRPITEEINTALSKAALSYKDYEKGFDCDKGKELLRSLVFSGCELYSAIIEEQLGRQEKLAEIIKKEYLQIVSTKNDVVIPFEFIYDHEVPDDDAELCPNWKISLTEGKCQESCTGHNRKTICPLGFWGLRKVIERHDVTPGLAEDNKEYFLQAETTSSRAELLIDGPGLFAASARVKAPASASVENSFLKAFGTAPLKATDWNTWESLVIRDKPHLIIALTHTNGTGSKATLEIGNVSIKSIQVRPSHVRPDETADYPLVALLGCDTTGSAVEYSSYISQFRRKGAAIVMGTVATVFGDHAAKVASMIVEEFTGNTQPAARLGEILRTMKQKAVADGLIMALCVVAFGDADWKLIKQ